MSAQQNYFTKEQKRAKYALEIVKNIKDNLSEYPKFRSYVERLPASIIMNGLGQSIAMEIAASRSGEKNRSTDNKTHEKLVNVITTWLKDEGLVPKGEKLIDWIIKSDQRSYLRAQEEIMAMLNWLKKFCQANLPKE